MLCLLHMKASGFLCHFLQKEPIGFPLKTFYWLSIWFMFLFFLRPLLHLGKEWEFNHTPLWAGAGAAGTVDSLVTSAQVSEESVLETQRTHNDIDSIQPLKPAHLKPFQHRQQLWRALGIKLAMNSSHVFQTEPLSSLLPPCRRFWLGLTIQQTCLALLKLFKRHNLATVLEARASWCVITQMFGVKQVASAGFSLDMCHHVSSCVSFWGEHKLTRLSCSSNYFCFPPLPRPGLSVTGWLPARAWLSIPEDVMLPYLSQVFAHGGQWPTHFSSWSWGLEWNLTAIISPLNLVRGPWWTDHTAHLPSTGCVHAFFRPICSSRSSVRTVHTALAL